MTAPWPPRSRRPYLDACPSCPDSPRVPPVAVSARLDGTVQADYLCGAGHVWVSGWARDPEHERWWAA